MKMYRMLVAAVFALCVAQGAWAVAPGGGMGGGSKSAQQQPQQEGTLVSPAAQGAGPQVMDPQQMQSAPEAPIVENPDAEGKMPIGRQSQPEAQNLTTDAEFALLSESHATKKEVRKQLKLALKNYRDASKVNSPESTLADDMLVLLVILCFFIPPLAVALYEGITTNFWISLILTLLFWLPGVIFSLLVVLDVI